MTKVIDGVTYLRIGEVAKLIDRSALTIKNWYQWAEETDNLDLLPPIYFIGEKRKIRHFREEDVPKLIKFRDSIQYGSMSEFNEKKWGDRDIKNKRNQPLA